MQAVALGAVVLHFHRRLGDGSLRGHQWNGADDLRDFVDRLCGLRLLIQGRADFSDFLARLLRCDEGRFVDGGEVGGVDGFKENVSVAERIFQQLQEGLGGPVVL